MQTPVRTTQHAPPLEEAPPARSSRGPIALVVAALIALVAVAAWAIADSAGDQPPTNQEITALVDQSMAAWTENDQQALLAIYTEDAYFAGLANDIRQGNTAIADYVDDVHLGFDFVVERASPTIVVGDTAITVVHYGVAGDLAAAVTIQKITPDGRIASQTTEPVRGLRVTG